MFTHRRHYNRAFPLLQAHLSYLQKLCTQLPRVSYMRTLTFVQNNFRLDLHILQSEVVAVGGRRKFDKSESRNNHPPGKPSDLDQFGDIRGRKPVEPGVGGGNSKKHHC